MGAEKHPRTAIREKRAAGRDSQSARDLRSFCYRYRPGDPHAARLAACSFRGATVAATESPLTGLACRQTDEGDTPARLPTIAPPTLSLFAHHTHSHPASTLLSQARDESPLRLVPPPVLPAPGAVPPPGRAPRRVYREDLVILDRVRNRIRELRREAQRDGMLGDGGRTSWGDAHLFNSINGANELSAQVMRDRRERRGDLTSGEAWIYAEQLRGYEANIRGRMADLRGAVSVTRGDADGQASGTDGADRWGKCARSSMRFTRRAGTAPTTASTRRPSPLARVFLSDGSRFISDITSLCTASQLQLMFQV